MIEYSLPSDPFEPLWCKYAQGGYAAGSGLYGFRMFVQRMVPKARVMGTTLSGITLVFDDDKDFTEFALKWS